MAHIKKSDNTNTGPFHVIISSTEETYRQGPYTLPVAQRVANFVISKGDSAVIVDKNKKQIKNDG